MLPVSRERPLARGELFQEAQMWLAAFALGLGSVQTLPAPDVSTSTDRPSVIQWNCKEIVVIGRVETISGKSIPDPTYLLGREAFQAKVAHACKSDQRLLGYDLPISYIEHVRFRDDHDFLLVLKPSGRGRLFQLSHAYIYDPDNPPNIARKCSKLGEDD